MPEVRTMGGMKLQACWGCQCRIVPSCCSIIAKRMSKLGSHPLTNRNAKKRKRNLLARRRLLYLPPNRSSQMQAIFLGAISMTLYSHSDRTADGSAHDSKRECLPLGGSPVVTPEPFWSSYCCLLCARCFDCFSA